LVLHYSNMSSVQSKAYSLTMKISPTCTKTFEFTAEAKVHFPISTCRPTLVTVTLQQESNEIALQNVLVDKYTRTTTIIPGDLFLIQQNNLGQIIYSRLSTNTETIKCQFPCYGYQRDVDIKQEDYNMQRLSTDLKQLDNRPVVLPFGKMSLVSGTEAQTLGAQPQASRSRRIKQALPVRARVPKLLFFFSLRSFFSF
jgi:hypothetical protein